MSARVAALIVRLRSRYVHPSENAVLDAMSRLGGHKIGHNQNEAPRLPVAEDDTNVIN